MVNVCIYFQVHQPFRVRRYSVFDIGEGKDYFDEEQNREIMVRVGKKCYLPANRMLLDLINATDGRFKVAFSITGTAIEQFKLYAPDVLESFKELAKSPSVEFLGETYYHSLSSLYSPGEFREQVELHKKMLKDEFGATPKVFRNTELIYTNHFADEIRKLKFKAVLAEGADHIMGWRSPNYVYSTMGKNPIKLLLKNYKLSDDIAFRFSNQEWNEFPLKSETYAGWINDINGSGDNVNLFMDYETIGEHQWASTGIFRFFSRWPHHVLAHSDNSFVLPSELINAEPVACLDVPHVVSWADIERDLSAWLGNKMQQASIKEIYAIEKIVKRSGDKKLISDWRRLQTSDHFYYMCTKYFADGDVHKYFNPYDTPYDSFIAFMNIMNDIIIRLKENEIVGKLATDIRAGKQISVSQTPSELLQGDTHD